MNVYSAFVYLCVFSSVCCTVSSLGNHIIHVESVSVLRRLFMVMKRTWRIWLELLVMVKTWADLRAVFSADIANALATTGAIAIIVG